jgi:hypothetical protein
LTEMRTDDLWLLDKNNRHDDSHKNPEGKNKNIFEKLTNRAIFFLLGVHMERLYKTKNPLSWRPPTLAQTHYHWPKEA